MFKKVMLFVFLVLSLCIMSGSASAIAPAEYIDGLWTPSPSAAGDPTYMFVNPGGLGDVLIYPYYNVRDGKISVFGVVNTSDSSGARVRIRFKEAADIPESANRDCDDDDDDDPQGSHEVLDFDICLSAGDMWVGRIISVDGAAVLKSDDNDTYVQFTDNAATGIDIFATRFPNGVPFKYGASNPVEGITADHTREGYFEIIAENRLTDACDDSESTTTTDDDCTCGNLLDVWADVTNVLMGVNYIVDLGDASTFGYNATAIAEFAISNISASIASARPNLREDNADDPGFIAPVNFILTKSDLYSIYDTETSKGGDTEFIITFPTKKLTQDQVVPLCTDIFMDPVVNIVLWDDEENFVTQVCEFSPCLTQEENELPFEINVLDINNSNIFTSDVETEIATSFNLGWAHIDLWNAAQIGEAHETTYNGATSRGLPAIGYNALGFGIGAPMGATHMLPMQYDSNVIPD
jgi:hypothetical protein